MLDQAASQECHASTHSTASTHMLTHSTSRPRRPRPPGFRAEEDRSQRVEKLPGAKQRAAQSGTLPAASGPARRKGRR
jgi:hypothetical protein